MKDKYISLDTEYKDSKNKFLTPVSAVFKDEETETIYKYFIYDNEDERVRFKNDLQSFIDRDYNIICYSASAEVRFLLAVGFKKSEILKMKIIDLYPLWVMLNQNKKECMWGITSYVDEDNKLKIIDNSESILKDGELAYGEKVWDEKNNVFIEGRDPAKKMFKRSLLDATECLLGIHTDPRHKEYMRNKILYSSVYTQSDIREILEYNESDISDLYRLYWTIRSYLDDIISNGKNNKEYDIEYIYKLSEWSVLNAIIENNGIPVDVERIRTFSYNYTFLYNNFIQSCNEMYPFYEEIKKKGKNKVRKFYNLFDGGFDDETELPEDKKYVLKKQNFNDFIDQLGIKWERTQTGGYSMKDDVLKEFEGIPQIAALRRTIKNLRLISSFHPNILNEKVLKNLGDDNKLRPSAGVFGTKTGRNTARPTEGYLLALSKWVRTLISAPEGYTIIGADYGSEETLIQGIMSSDYSFIDAYKSNDTYVWFAKKCKMIPENVDKLSDGKFYQIDETEPILLDKELQNKYKSVRRLFKAILLGVGYGMGPDKLATSLNVVLISNLPEDKKELFLKSRTEGGEYKKEWDEYYESVRYVSGLEIDGTSEYPEERKATTYKRFHEETFNLYKMWKKKKVDDFKTNPGYLINSEGWMLINSVNHSATTAANFLIQSTGVLVLRAAVKKCLEKGMNVFATQHDSIYILVKNEEKERAKKALKKFMIDGFEEVLKSRDIKVDVEEYKTDWDTLKSTWTKEEGSEELKRFGKYLNKKLK